MKLRFLYTFINVLSLSLVCQANEADLSYTLSRKDSTTLQVEVTFTGTNPGHTLLYLPNEWASQKSLYKAISAITAISPNTAIEPTEKPYIYNISYRPGKKVAFSYLLHKDWSGPLKHPLYFRPVIQSDYFYFEGYSGLVYPKLSDTTHIKCRLIYSGFAKDDFIGNSFFANTKAGNFTVGLDDLLNSVFCAGKFRSKTLSVNGKELVIAIAGKPAFSDEEAFSNISKIILEERKFWKDKGPDYYFTLFMPLYDKDNTGGTAHYHAFSLFQSADLGMEGNLLPMIAHEYFHNWLGLGL
jgi:predicted metalloprotease with PDZ domain